MRNQNLYEYLYEYTHSIMMVLQVNKIKSDLKQKIYMESCTSEYRCKTNLNAFLDCIT